MWRAVLAFVFVVGFFVLATLSLYLALDGPHMRAGLIFAGSLLSLLALAFVMRDERVPEEGLSEI